MTRLDSAKLFFTGIKSEQMKSIERRFPTLRGFYRGEAFFHAFGNLDLYDVGHTFLILLPAHQKFEWRNYKCGFSFNCRLFAFYRSSKMLK